MQSDTTIPDDKTTLAGLGPKLTGGLGAVGLVLVVAGFGLGLWEKDGLSRFFHSYLVSFCFVVSLSLGAMFFVAVHHAARAGWGVTVRRICEIVAANFTLLLILFLPIIVPLLMGNHVLYPWADPAAFNPKSELYNELIVHKEPYLSVPFFGLRAVGYFVIWWLISRFYLVNSVAQDASGDPRLSLRMERWSGPALILFAFTVTFAAIDWLMSLEPEWFSTIFGLYIFSGAVIGGLAAVILVTMFVQAAGCVRESITAEHYHDLGKLLFSFVVFWGYMAFSQYMLIWYANIPEETAWFQPRQTPAWVPVSLALLFGHLLIPFFGLLPREVKRRKPPLAFWAVWLLVFHWVDLYWIVMPSFTAERFPLGPMDVCLALGLVCLYLAGVVRTAGDKALVPLRDPRLGEALAFENF